MKVGMYRMENNRLLGNCFAFVFSLDDTEMPGSFTRPEILMLVKTADESWNTVRSKREWDRNGCFFGGKTPMLRIGSECMLGIFGDSHCDCEEERIEAMKMIRRNGAGIFIQLPQEAQGYGLLYKVQELNLQVSGVLPDGTYVGAKTQTEAARLLLGIPIIDSRNYEIIVEALRMLGLDEYTYSFMSRNVNKVRELKACGLKIDRMVDITTTITVDNAGEVLIKWIKKGFCFTTDEAIQVIALLNCGEALPTRAKDLILEAASLYETSSGKEWLLRKSHLDDMTESLLEKAVLKYAALQNKKAA